MNTEDKKEFKSIIEVMFATFGKPIPPREVIHVWWNVFEKDSMEDVRSAFSQAVSESTQFLVPGVVRKYIPDRSGFLGPEDAWNHAPKYESEGAWVYREMMEAVFSCTNSVMRGDQIGARMAFLETYKKAVAESKAIGIRPKWFYSEASGLTRAAADQQKIQQTIKAREKQWISHEEAKRVLMIADQSAPNPKILEMISGGKVTKEMPGGSLNGDTPRIGQGSGT